jgi:hypothetical protein
MGEATVMYSSMNYICKICQIAAQFYEINVRDVSNGAMISPPYYIAERNDSQFNGNTLASKDTLNFTINSS